MPQLHLIRRIAAQLLQSCPTRASPPSATAPSSRAFVDSLHAPPGHLARRNAVHIGNGPACRRAAHAYPTPPSPRSRLQRARVGLARVNQLNRFQSAR
ncbi:MAG: hypothetical protein IPO91_34600 [Chloroflexi bacterium]|nr:hypothetical protein [Chloroflexota bacterium]